MRAIFMAVTRKRGAFALVTSAVSALLAAKTGGYMGFWDGPV